MGREIRVGLTLLLEVKKSGRRCYVNLPGTMAGNYLLESGDLLRTEIKALIRKGEEGESDAEPEGH